MKFNEEKEILLISGALVKMEFGKLKSYVGGKERLSEKEYYQLCVATIEDKDIATIIKNRYYANTAPAYTPKWITGEAEVKDGKLYVNMKSLFDIKWFIEDECLTYSDVKQRYGSLIGSKVTVSLVCKEGALYVQALKVDELKTVSINDYFA